MRTLRTAMLAFGLMALAGACGGKDKGAQEPAPATTEPAANPCGGAPANPCGGEAPANPCGGANPQNPCGGGE